MHTSLPHVPVPAEHIRMTVFDVAGTTVWDGADPVARAVCDALATAGVRASLADVDPVMGRSKPLAIRTLITQFRGVEPGDEEVAQVHDTFRSYVMRYYREDPGVKPMPGAEACFAALRVAGIRVTLDTGFDRETLEVILARLGWHGRVDDTITSDEVQRGRPAPDLIDELRRRAGIEDASAVCKVGDSVSDVEQGLNAGCGMVVGVLSGRTRPIVASFPGVLWIEDPRGMPEILGLKGRVHVEASL